MPIRYSRELPLTEKEQWVGAMASSSTLRVICLYTRAICCRESSLIRSCNRRQIHIVLIRSGGVNYICRIIVCSIWRSLLSCAGSQNCQRTYRQNNQFRFHTFLLSSLVSRFNGTLVLCHNYFILNVRRCSINLCMAIGSSVC